MMNDRLFVDAWLSQHRNLRKAPATWPRNVVVRYGKQLASTYLERFGIKTIAEIPVLIKKCEKYWQTFDLIANDDGEIVLIDVRTTVGEDCVPPLPKVTRAQKRAMRAAVIKYLENHPEVIIARHDVLSVYIVNNTLFHVRPLIAVVQLTRDEIAA